nr:MAG TPA: hypothetical protein [Caudoviricetes sp.]
MQNCFLLCDFYSNRPPGKRFVFYFLNKTL